MDNGPSCWNVNHCQHHVGSLSIWNPRIESRLPLVGCLLIFLPEGSPFQIAHPLPLPQGVGSRVGIDLTSRSCSLGLFPQPAAPRLRPTGILQYDMTSPRNAWKVTTPGKRSARQLQRGSFIYFARIIVRDQHLSDSAAAAADTSRNVSTMPSQILNMSCSYSAWRDLSDLIHPGLMHIYQDRAVVPPMVMCHGSWPCDGEL